MLRLVPLLVLLWTSFEEALEFKTQLELNGRIMGGTNTTIEDHPHQVSVSSNRHGYLCGGTLIGADIVITAAHCVYFLQASDIVVRLGSTSYHTDGAVVHVKRRVLHHNFNWRNIDYDVAIIQLVEAVNASSEIGFIKLAEISPSSGTPATVTGWGIKDDGKLSEVLQQVELLIVERDSCQGKCDMQITETMICAYAVAKDACQGDSGGPLVVDNKLLGIVSGGRGCALPNCPGFYTDLTTVANWITDTMEDLKGNHSRSTINN